MSTLLLPEETLAVPAEARAFAEAVLRPRAGELNDATESAAIFPRDLVTAIADAGLYGFCSTPTSAGVDCNSRSWPRRRSPRSWRTSPQASPRLSTTRLIRGEIVGSFATSEPAASTDLAATSMLTRATAVPGGYRLTGRKRWITNSCAADIVTVLCVVDDA